MDVKMNSSYIAVEVPVKQDAGWFKELREKISEHGISVKWQDGHYHITLAFIFTFPSHYSPLAPLFQSVAYKVAPYLTFDKVDAFTTLSGQHIVHLTSSSPSEGFKDIVKSVRDTVDKLGCEYAPDFKLHVTLGRVDGSQTSLEELKHTISEISVPSFTLRLINVSYLEHQTHEEYDSVVMFQDEKTAKEAWEQRVREAFRNAGSNVQLYTDPDSFL